MGSCRSLSQSPLLADDRLLRKPYNLDSIARTGCGRDGTCENRLTELRAVSPSDRYWCRPLTTYPLSSRKRKSDLAWLAPSRVLPSSAPSSWPPLRSRSGSHGRCGVHATIRSSYPSLISLK